MNLFLAEAHRVVMQRTANRYLVMEAATFGDKLFTGSLIIITIVAILVLFWFRNFGPVFSIIDDKYENLR